MRWMHDYSASDLKHDLLAALVVTAIIVPEGMAYARLAGLGPEAVFYTAPWALLAYALIGPSKRLVVATSGAAAALCGSVVAGAEGMDPSAAAASLALIAGGALLLAGLLRMGFIASFFSRPVLTGFVFGLAAVITVKQLPKLLGLEGGEGNFFERLWVLGGQLGGVEALPVLLGLGALASLFALERFLPAIPAPLIVLLAAIGASLAFDFDARGLALVGAVDAGLVPPALPQVELSELLALVPEGLGLALVVFAEGIGNASGIASRHDEKVNPNRELIGFGAAGLAVAFMQGFPPGTSLSNSAANDRAGARTKVSSALAAGLLILVALFLTPAFAPLPEAVLAAIVIFAISGMFEVSALVRYYRVDKTESLTALAALFGVLVFETLPGLGLGVALSMLLLLYRASRPNLTRLGRAPGGAYVSVEDNDEAKPVEGVLVLRVGGPLWFANASQLCEEIDAQQPKGLKALVLDLEESPSVDVSSLESLGELIDRQRARGVPLIFARVHRRVRERLERDELLPAKGVRLARSVREAVAPFVAA